jgi:hypothetical protein
MSVRAVGPRPFSETAVPSSHQAAEVRDRIAGVGRGALRREGSWNQTMAEGRQRNTSLRENVIIAGAILIEVVIFALGTYIALTVRRSVNSL